MRDEAEHRGDSEAVGLGARPRRDAVGVGNRRWAGALFAVLGVLLLPWALWLGYSLPERKIAHHWDLAWAGFDVVLSLALLGTAVALLTGRPVGRSFAAATGALLLADAWFDVVLESRGAELKAAIVEALFAELPVAALCFWIAYHTERFLSLAVDVALGREDPSHLAAARERAAQRDLVRVFEIPADGEPAREPRDADASA